MSDVKRYKGMTIGSLSDCVLAEDYDQLKAENESMRKAVSWAIQVHRDPELEHEIRNEEWLEDLEAAISSPENH